MHVSALIIARIAVATLATVVFLAFIPPPAHADLLFPAGPHAAAGAALFAKLPPSLHRITGEVTELDEDGARKAGFGKELAGRAFSEGSIQLRESCWDPAYLLHEAAHLAWWEILSDGDRAEWSRFWEKHPKAMPRDYARTDAAEGWADSFSVVYMPSDTACVPLGGVGAGVAEIIHRLTEQER